MQVLHLPSCDSNTLDLICIIPLHIGGTAAKNLAEGIIIEANAKDAQSHMGGMPGGQSVKEEVIRRLQENGFTFPNQIFRTLNWDQYHGKPRDPVDVSEEGAIEVLLHVSSTVNGEEYVADAVLQPSGTVEITGRYRRPDGKDTGPTDNIEPFDNARIVFADGTEKNVFVPTMTVVDTTSSDGASEIEKPEDKVVIELTIGGERSYHQGVINDGMVMQGRHWYPGVSLEGPDPYICELVESAINEGGELFASWDAVEGRPSLAFRVVRASSQQLARIRRLISTPPPGVVVRTEDGYRFTVQPDGSITDGHLTCDSLEQMQVGFTMVAPDADPTAVVSTIGELMKALKHFQSAQVEPEVRDLEVNSGCGEACATVLLKGNELAELCADRRDTIVEAVLGQCRVFYFG